jgi:hypothetical protein
MLPLIKFDKNRPRRTRRLALAAAAAVLVVALLVAFGARRTRSEGATVKATTADGMVVNERLRPDRGVRNENALPLREGTGSGR